MNVVKSKLPLALKFYLALGLPLILVSIAVIVMSIQSQQNDGRKLDSVLRIEEKTNRLLSGLTVKEELDPRLFTELEQEAGSGRFREVLQKIQAIDRNTQSKEYESLIHELDRVGGEDLREASLILHRNNRVSITQIILALVLCIALVFFAIRQLAREVEKSDRNTKSLLAVLSEGLFFFDDQGAIASERSQTLARILPDSPDIQTLAAFVRRYKPTMADNVDLALKLLWNKDGDDFFSDMGSTLSLLPREFINDAGRIIHLEYRPMHDAANQLERIVVVVADVTLKLQQEKEAIIQAERVKKISRVAAHMDDYLSFLDESIGIFKRADGLFHQPDTSGDAQLKRDLHTLKGSLATAEFSRLAHSIHELESQIEEDGLRAASVLRRWEQVKDQWKFETTDIAEVLGLGQRMGRLSVIRSKFDAALQAAKQLKDGTILGILQDCLRLPPRDIFGKYQNYLEKLGQKLGGKQVSIVFTADSSDIAPAEVQKLEGAFVHILRNSVDHGIETPDVREQRGKPTQGTIQWAVYRRSNGTLHFIIKDDGQGVNADKLAQKAVQGGHWTEEKARTATTQEKVELLFLPQLSSRDEITETSGRGVGMDAVKEQLARLGGTITVYSEPGVGTQFEIDVPGTDISLAQAA